MDWLKKVNNALNYIEDNLDQDIDLEMVARKAGCSVYHFQRIFTYATDISVAEYIRRRRMTLAACELQQGNEKVIDLALKYGYDSPDSFCRAFQKIHGVTPSYARNSGVSLKVYPRISFQLIIKGDVAMKYRIEKRKGFQILGKSMEIEYDQEKQYGLIEDFVGKCIQDGTVNELLATTGMKSFEEVIHSSEMVDGEIPIGGLFAFYGHNTSSFKFMIAVDYHGNEQWKEWELLTVPESTWAVFEIESNQNTAQDLDTVNLIWKRLGEWFQSSDYDHRSDMPELEKRFKTKNGYRAEVWIPIISNL
jgi:AraC family transcriptional regulator